MFKLNMPFSYGVSDGPIIVAFHRNISLSDSGPAEQFAGVSLFNSCNYFCILRIAILFNNIYYSIKHLNYLVIYLHYNILSLYIINAC